MGLEQQTVANGSRNQPNLQTQQDLFSLLLYPKAAVFSLTLPASEVLLGEEKHLPPVTVVQRDKEEGPDVMQCGTLESISKSAGKYSEQASKILAVPFLLASQTMASLSPTIPDRRSNISGIEYWTILLRLEKAFESILSPHWSFWSCASEVTFSFLTLYRGVKKHPLSTASFSTVKHQCRQCISTGSHVLTAGGYLVGVVFLEHCAANTQAMLKCCRSSTLALPV
ncbi:hypothetical protein UY3_06012 [Chelonia mydas]|uniref:Uncharacterized protein n=1 Tax=Chelonia mydas TaxID=8469 RepID=M7BFX6_CHEMY|nr:hypothetical protein UY3_06012 [Chelonia mydas]